MQKPLSGKGDIRYWQKRVRKTRSVRGESVTENAFYSVELQHRGRRMGLSLGTTNQMEAAARAKAFCPAAPESNELSVNTAAPIASTPMHILHCHLLHKSPDIEPTRNRTFFNSLLAAER